MIGPDASSPSWYCPPPARNSIPIIPALLPLTSSDQTSPISSHSQSNSSSPSTTAFATPASSLGETSQHPSPHPRASQSQSQLAAALAALHNQNHGSPIPSRPMSTRPAPPSPIAISRRQSTRSNNNLSLSRPVSRPLSGLVLYPDIKPSDTLDPSTILSTTTERPLTSFPSALTPSSPPRPAIIVRDYAFDVDDDRYRGQGPFVPKWNKVERLIRILVDAARDDEEAREKRRKRKEKKERKRKERKERRMRRMLMRDAWSGGGSGGSDEGDVDDDNGWGSSDESGRRVSDDDSSDSTDESGGMDEGPTQDEGYEEYQQEEYVEDIPSGPLLPGLYRALYVFEPEGEAEMGLEEGQVVRVVGRGGGVGWAVVVDEREERGSLGGHALVPESYLEVVRLDGEDDGEQDDG